MQALDETLPILRDDLKLIESSIAEDGSKQWLLYDAIQNKYFTIGIDAFNLLSLWENSCKIDDFLVNLKNKKYDINRESLQIFLNFITNNKLVKIQSTESIKKVYEEEKNSKQTLFKWLLHNYLFIRLPLLKPDRWLDDNMPIANLFYSNIWRNFVLILGFIGIVLTLRNLDEFFATFSYLFSKEGMFYYFLSIIFVKSFHELGHAFTAKKYGARVPTMGVAFLVLFPVLYTDTTDSWKIKSKYKRLKIVMAGMKVELYLALIATFFWSFLDDGIFRSIAFVIATTSWITSLLINISPFLRFDGYYALSDWSDSKNLQPRSFAIAKWFIRRNILGSDEQVPEFLPKYKHNFFIIYAILTWIYRFFLFLGIAVLVYYFTFKALGIFLFIVEILWFIILPIYKELKIWFEKINTISLNRRNISSLLFFIAIISLLIIPWNNKVYMPAVLEAQKYIEIYAPYNAQIKEINVKNGSYVKKGDTLLILDSSENSFLLKQVNSEIEFLELQLKKVAASRDNLNNKFILEEKLLRKQKNKEGLQKIQDSFVVKADFDGIVYKNDSFHVNQWINKKEAIFTLYEPTSLELIAFCSEDNLKYINNKQKAVFLLNSGDYGAIETNITHISNISLPFIEFPELSSLYGGNIAVREDSKNQLISEKAYYKVKAKLIDFDTIYKIRKDGVLIVEAEPLSVVDKLTKKVMAILIRESGF